MKGGDAKNFIDGSFCLAVLAKLDTADDRERHMLKALCLKVYIKFTEHRKLLRHCMNHEFNRFSYETGKHQGVVELLEILEPIVKGFKAPLKPDHLETMERAILPLHCASIGVLKSYHSQLRKLVALFMDKDACLVGPIIIKRLRKFWPHQCGPKQCLLIMELEEVLEHIEMDMWEQPAFDETRKCLFKLIASIINSEHFQVCEKGLKLWDNKFLTDGCLNFQRFGEEFLEAGFTALYFKSHEHWQNNSKLKRRCV